VIFYQKFTIQFVVFECLFVKRNKQCFEIGLKKPFFLCLEKNLIFSIDFRFPFSIFRKEQGNDPEPKTKRGYKMKKVTKKEIRAAIKANDRTKVWHLCALKLGRTPTKNEVCKIVEEINEKKAWFFSYKDTERTITRRKLADELFIKKGGYRSVNYKEVALRMLRRLAEEDYSSYSKVPMLGHEHLYFCSTGYGFKDYNKVRTCEIKGNEEFCKKVVEIGNRIYQKKVVVMKESV